MLDTDTKRRIDTARDILVGKVPDPKSQVEQITIAMIYKFMDDMDAESEEFGGQRRFFAGEFARYGWAKLMRSGLGGFETLNLYAEGIAKMPENPGIPPLFRDIFKNAYLPYRDPETLRVFLKVIDEFEYDHSERLGDAFEYLLSVLSSQGDAGQFRTPRHIIDFIVEVIDPKKNETVLDPACGTAGFLISSYKHILRANTDANGNSTLTPDERGRLAQSFTGYDISPDMVRLSLVNMYLHGFVDPHIYEYDTLTSQDRWNEYADVILANPPFMSPKGGIRPHNRFSVQSKRSEVLFVDYMAEHLTPSGRAGIIVPEGIIFQSQTAYTKLRKMLVEENLVAVVSLPAGVFNPYSGVKTCILILDRSLAKKTDTIGFFKIENDGFGLGSQRRAIDKNDLPQARAEIAEYLRRLQTSESVEGFQPALGLLVAREKIQANGDYNLSGERYREGATTNHSFPLVRIGDVCTLNPRKRHLGGLPPDTRVSFVPMADINEHRMAFQPRDEKPLSNVSASYTYFQDNDVLLAKVTPCFENGKAGIARGLLNGIGFGSSEFYVLRSSARVLPEWVYFCFMHPLFRDSAVAQMTGTGGLQRVPRKFVENFPIPLPPLEVQKDITAEIEGYQKVIDGARAVLDNYRPHISIHLDWPVVELGDVVSFSSGGTPSKGNDAYWVGDIPWVSAKDMKSDVLLDASMHVSQAAVSDTAAQVAPAGSLLILVRGMGLANGVPICELARPCAFNQDVKAIWPDSTVNATFLRLMLKQEEAQFRRILGTAAHGTLKISTEDLSQVRFPLPPLAAQEAVVDEIEAEQALVAANRELIARFETKIQASLARVWGQDEPTEARHEPRKTTDTPLFRQAD
jgi:type I restriction enzyme M protein